MKSFNKFFSVLTLLAVSVTACQIADEHLNQGTVLEVTGVIAGDSRVTYEVNGDNTITPSWAEGDAIIGFDDLGQTFTFTVSSINAGIATFDTGEYSPTGSEEKLYAIYAPGVEESEIDTKTLSVNLNAQNGVLDTDAKETPRTPALMCATATVNGSKVLFTFTNQTAIIGVKQFKLRDVTAATDVTSMTLNGVITEGTFSVDGESGELTLTPTGSASSITATGTWTTDESGLCATGVYFAAIPTTEASLSLDATAGGKNYINVSAITPATLSAGRFYYMNKLLGEPEASVTIGGLTTKYMTIGEAWSAANAATSPATVTLLQDCEAEAQLALNASVTGAVTLDLNGCKLTTITSDHGILVDNRTLTIEDSGSGGEIESESADNMYLLSTTHSANVTVSSGKLTSDYRAIMVQTNATVDIKGTAAISASNVAVYSNGTLKVYGNATIKGYYGIYVSNGTTTISENATVTAPEDGKYGCYVYSASYSPKLVVEGGTIRSLASSYLNNAIRVAANGTAEISGGTIYGIATPIYIINSGSVSIEGDASISSTNGSYALINSNTANQSTLTIEGGRFTAPGINPVSGSGSSYVTGGLFNRPVNNSATRDTLDTPYYNTLNTDAETKGDYPYCLVSNELEGVSLAATATKGTTVYDHASIESAINHVTVDASATNTELAIQLLEDAETSSTLTMTGASKNASLDLNNCTWTSTASPALASNVLSFTLYDSSSDGAGELSTTGNVALSVTAGTTTVNSGSLVAASDAVSVASTGTLTVGGGHFYGGDSSDIANDGGSVAVSGGWFRNNLDASFVADGYESAADTETFNERSYSYTIATSVTVATVNDVDEYGNLAAAINAANEYDGAADTVTIKIVAENDTLIHNNAIDLNNTGGKPIVLDLNGHFLSTSTASFITSTGTSLVTIKNSGATGKIISSEKNIISLTTANAKIKLDGCIVESTAPASSTNADAAIYFYRNGSTNRPQLTIENGAQVYTQNGVTTIYSFGGHLILNGCEITSGTVGSGRYAIYTYTASQIDVNEGASIYSNNNDNFSAIHCGTANSASITINGGYMYGKAALTAGGSNYCETFTINGGFFNTDVTKISGYTSHKINGSIIPCADGYHTPEPTGVQLEYSYKFTSSVAEVNGEGYDTFAKALTAAKEYDGEGDVTITLLKSLNYAESITLKSDVTSKTTTLDLNGHTLTAGVQRFIQGTRFIITDTKGTGQIESEYNEIIYPNVSNGSATLDGCKIVSKLGKGTYYYSSRAVSCFANNCTLTIKGNTVIEAEQTAIYCASTTSTNSPKVTIESATISSTGSYCIYVAATGKVTVDGGTFHSAGYVCCYIGNKNATFEINHGYFSRNEGTGNLLSGATDFKFTLSGGYYSKALSFSDDNIIKLDVPKTVGDITYTHAHRSEVSGEAAAAASLTEAVASYGAPVSGGVKFLRK